MQPENTYNKYSRYGSWAVSFGVLLLVCSFIYFIVLQEKAAELQKRTADSVISGLRKIHYLDSARHVKDSINLSLKNALSSTINQDNISKQPSDTHLIGKIDIDAARAINSYGNVNDQFWVYVGQIINEQWRPKNFVFDQVPERGNFVLSAATVYKRNMLPLKQQDQNWKLGEITGAVNEGILLKIDEVQKIEDNNYWALAELYNWVIVMGGNKDLGQTQQNLSKLKSADIPSLIVYRQGSYRNISQPFKLQADATTFINKNKENIPTDAYIVKLSTWAPKLSFNGTYYTDNGQTSTSIFNTEFIRTNIEFTLNGEYTPEITGTLINSANKKVNFDIVNNADRRINWTAYLPNGKYTITLTDGRYKLAGNSYTFSFTTNQVNSGIALVAVPLALK